MTTFRRHFRFCNFTKHPAYIVKETKTSYVYLSITHAPYYHGRKCIPLSTFYLVPDVLVADKYYFSHPCKGKYKFARADGPIIRDMVKGRYIDKKSMKGKYADCIKKGKG